MLRVLGGARGPGLRGQGLPGCGRAGGAMAGVRHVHITSPHPAASTHSPGNEQRAGQRRVAP